MGFYPKSFKVLVGEFDRSGVARETLSGISVGLIALPLSLALGIASIPGGLHTPIAPPAMGLITAIVGGFLISALGGSRVQIGGPTAAFVPIILLIVSRHGYAGLVIATFMAGIIQILMGASGMGSLIKFIPWPVTSGFTTGIAVSIMLTQVPDFLGIRSGGMPGEFHHRIEWVASHVQEIHPATVFLAVACLGCMALWPRIKIPHIPGSIVAMVAATLLVALLPDAGRWHLATIGSKFGPSAILDSISLIPLPSLSWAMIGQLMGPATAIALLGSIESLLSAVVADGLTGRRHDSNTELIAQGIANLACPLFGGIPATGAIARTSANISNGARTPLSGMIHAATLLLVILAASRLVCFVPMASMSAVLIMVAFKMGEWHELARLSRMPRSDALVLVTTFCLTVVFDLVVAVEIGMVLAAMLFIKRVSETTEVSRVTGEDMLESPEQMAQGKEIPEGAVVFRIFGPFLFGAGEKMEDALSALGHQDRVLILRMHLVSAMDATALNVLESIVERFRRHKGVVILSGLHQQPLQMIVRSGFLEVVERENLCATFDDALVRARKILS